MMLHFDRHPRFRAPGAAILIACAVVSVTSPARALPAFEGHWRVRMADSAEATRGVPLVHVALMTPGLNTFYVELSRLEGLGRDVFTSPPAPARFRLRRDAGTFEFHGTFRNGKGEGRFQFIPDSAFAGELVRRGIGRPTPEQHFSFGRHDVTLAFLDELAAHKYAIPSLSTLDAAGMSSADLRYVREMAAAGYRVGTLDSLMRLSNNGVTPRFIRELANLGYPGLTASQLIRLKSMGVSADVARQRNRRAGRTLSVDELVKMVARDREAERDASTEVEGASGQTTDKSTPYTGRWNITDVRGNLAALEYLWDDDTQWRRWIPLSELTDLNAALIGPGARTTTSFTIDQDAGRFEFKGMLGAGRGSGTFRFVPKRDFVDTLRLLGVSGVESVSDHALKNLAFGSLSTSYVRGFQDLGFTSLTVSELQDLAIRHASPGYVKALRELGVVGTDNLQNVVDLRFAEIPIEYVKELSALGYRDLTVRQLRDLRHAGVTIAFAREIRQANATTPSVDELIEARAGARARERERTRKRP